MQLKDSATVAYSAEPEVLTISVLKDGVMSILQGLADLRLINIKKQENAFVKASLKEAAELLYKDYKNDKSLTEFTQLDAEIFYEAK
ncbi:MAG: hypothetical protein LBC85_06530 [Fibromonadaceae bacterium]|jgi:hypothetical protein|nr:hypothetical protein [Fibromonadaceae bacterium]